MRRAHVRARESDLHKQESNARIFACDAEVGSKCNTRACTRGRAVQTGDNRLQQSTHVVDEFARHPCKLKQTLHVAAEQFADDVVHVAARTERATRSGDDNHAHVSLVTQRSKRISQFPINFKRQRIQTFRTIQRDRRDALFVLLVKEGRWLLHAGINAIPSISTFASSSSSPATSTSTIAGKCLPMYLRYRSPTSRVCARYSLLFVT